jgi:hypothetical protein
MVSKEKVLEIMSLCIDKGKYFSYNPETKGVWLGIKDSRHFYMDWNDSGQKADEILKWLKSL